MWRSCRAYTLPKVVLECGKMIDTYGLSLLVRAPGQMAAAYESTLPHTCSCNA